MLIKNYECEFNTCVGSDFGNAVIHNLSVICDIALVHRTSAQNCPRIQQYGMDCNGILKIVPRWGILLENNDNIKEIYNTQRWNYLSFNPFNAERLIKTSLSEPFKNLNPQ
jgi:hypothetical protein